MVSCDRRKLLSDMAAAAVVVVVFGVWNRFCCACNLFHCFYRQFLCVQFGWANANAKRIILGWCVGGEGWGVGSTVKKFAMRQPAQPNKCEIKRVKLRQHNVDGVFISRKNSSERRTENAKRQSQIKSIRMVLLMGYMPSMPLPLCIYYCWVTAAHRPPPADERFCQHQRCNILCLQHFVVSSLFPFGHERQKVPSQHEFRCADTGTDNNREEEMSSGWDENDATVPSYIHQR